MINGLDGLIYEKRLKGLIICIFVKEQLRRDQELLTRGSRTVNTLNAFHQACWEGREEIRKQNFTLDTKTTSAINVRKELFPTGRTRNLIIREL